MRAAENSPRTTTKAKSAASTMQTRTPNSSPMTAKMKSVWESGRMRLMTPSPGPLPNQDPAMKLSSAVSDWKFAGTPATGGGGSRKDSMRAWTCGTNL